MPPVTRILVVDDEHLVRSGICHSLLGLPNIEVVGQTGSGEEAIKLCKKLQPNLVLLDLKIGDISGIEVATELLAVNPQIKIIIITASLDSSIITKLFKLGIVGFLNKADGFKDLVKAIQTVSLGHHYTTPVINKDNKNTCDNPLDLLSERELQVALLIYYGWLAEDICEKLAIDSSTLKTYRSRLYEKLHIKNVVELTVLINRFGLLTES